MDLLASVVSEEHLRRRAFVYVRQSTFEQVRFNTGSTLVQLSQRECIKKLGWGDDMIESSVSAGPAGRTANAYEPDPARTVTLVDDDPTTVRPGTSSVA